MPTLDAGDLDCTTGIAGRVYAQLLADARNGFSSPLADVQADAIRAICYAAAKGVADEINADGGLGGPLSISASEAVIITSPTRYVDDGYLTLVRYTFASPPENQLTGFVQAYFEFECAAAAPAGTLISTLPAGYIPISRLEYGAAIMSLMGTDGSVARLRLDYNGVSAIDALLGGDSVIYSGAQIYAV